MHRTKVGVQAAIDELYALIRRFVFTGDGVTTEDDGDTVTVDINAGGGSGLSVAGAGLVESPPGTVNVAANGDASIVVNPNDVQVAAPIQSGAALGTTALQPAGNLTGSIAGVAVATVVSGAASGATAVQPARAIITGATSGLAGGGTLAADVNLSATEVSATSKGAAPAITGGNRVLQSNALGTAATWQTPGSSGNPVVAALVSNYTNNSTTGTEVTGLSQTVQPGSYRFEYDLIARSAATTTGLALGMNFTGTHTALVARMEYASTGAAASTGIIDDDTVGATDQLQEAFATRTESTTVPDLGPLTGFAAANVDHYIQVLGVIVVTVAGDLELWCASEVAASQVDLRVGSSLILWKTS